MGSFSMSMIFSVLIILLSERKAAASTAEQEKYTYNAAVVEYHPDADYSLTAEEILSARTKSYIEQLKNVEENLDIIVFPEATLFPPGNLELSSEVPEPFEKIICNSTDEKYGNFLKEFSCAAIEFNTTIVINGLEKENCTLMNSTGHCPESGVAYYNTDIVFNESGFISGRYRKWNLYGEYMMSKPSSVELVTITTNDNDTFGIFTCFDIMFETPALNLTRDMKVKNIIFPTNWFSELPYLTAHQVQQMWAQENKVNLLAAGGSNPLFGSGGSGIFVAEKGPLITEFIGGKGGTKTLVKRVPRLDIDDNPYLNFSPIDENIDELAVGLDRVTLLTDITMNNHSSMLLDTTEHRIVEEVCNGKTIKLCCLFDITISVNKTMQRRNGYVYHMVVFSGQRSYNSGLAKGGIESCALIACLNESLSSCGQRFSNYSEISWPITFENISVSASFPEDSNRIQYPNSLLSSLRPISPQHTVWKKEKKGSVDQRMYVVNKPQNRLLSFGIYGRDFNRDGMWTNKSTKLDSICIYSVLCVGLVFIVSIDFIFK